MDIDCLTANLITLFNIRLLYSLIRTQVIKKSSNTILNEVVQEKKDNPAYKLDINGHTDSRGFADINLDLSLRRAVAVMNYLILNGIEVSRLHAKGYGQIIPVANNATAKRKSYEQNLR